MSTIRIAIDGPSGAGKSTLARSIAEKLGYLYVDTGAIYRTLGYHIYAKGLNPKDGTAVSAELPGLRVEMSHGRDGLQRMLLNGQDVTERIRLPEVSMYASAVSAHPSVRTYLLEMQRALARTHNVIMDGRDIGQMRRSRYFSLPRQRPGRTGGCWSWKIGGHRSPTKRCWQIFKSGTGTTLTER